MKIWQNSRVECEKFNGNSGNGRILEMQYKGDEKWQMTGNWKKICKCHFFFVSL